MPIDTSAIRRQFPFLANPRGIVYLDSAASAQKPVSVLRAMEECAGRHYANVHRGIHPLAEEATSAYEQARTTVQRFIGARHSDEIVFTKNCTEALNLVAKSWGKKYLKKGDIVVLSILEHHSNIVPWLQLKEELGIVIAWIDIDSEGKVKMEELSSILSRGSVKLLSITGQSNVLGVRTPIKEIITLAHRAGAVVCVDAAQLVGHHAIDVSDLDCDFLAFSGHKPYGPTGIGVLYAKRAILSAMPPFLGGGMMIGAVTKDSFTAADPPQRFEAGTPPIIEAVGLTAALDWLKQFSWKDIEEYKARLLAVAFEMLRGIESIRILGPQHPEGVSGCVSFVIDDVHPHDLTDLLGKDGLCLRAGHHCTQPLHRRLGIPASTRLSIALYNTEEEIRSVGPAIERARRALLK